MDYFYLKALHLVFIVTWFSGLFYIVRLFIYHREALDKSEPEKQILVKQFAIMEKRLWYGITCPSAVLTLIFGLSLIRYHLPLSDHPWLLVKFAFLIGLFVYHFHCGHMRKKLLTTHHLPSSNWLRVYNEVATLFLVAIVFLAVLKSALAMGKGLIGLIVFSAILMSAIRIYKRVRSK